MASDEVKYVMLSYNQKSKSTVIQVKEQLENNDIPVWFDERDMEDNMYDSMPKAVGNAFVVCCFMTLDYENSRNCKLELEHAQRGGKRIIPCMASDRKVWKPSPNGWLNFITGSIIAIDFSGTSDEQISASIKKLIDRINEKPPASSSSSPSSSSSSSSSSSVSKPSDFFISIRHEYLRNSRIKRMMNEEKSFSIEKSYINLAIVKTEEQRDKEKKLRETQHNDGIISSFEQIYGTKTSVEVKDIFEKCKNQTKQVLVLGRAGIGKSTFCRYASYQWAKGELWAEQYQLVILIRLRLLTNSRYPPGPKYSPIDLVEKEYFPCDTVPDESRKYFKELCNKGKVLWLLDGYDEFAQNIPEHLQVLFNHIHGTQHHILTSRPYSIRLPYEVKMEIIGFTDDNIAKYVDQFFDQIKDDLDNALSEGQNLLSFLEKNPGIWGVAHIPVNLELICSFWVNIDRSKANIFTMTELYDTMIEWLCRRYLTNRNIDNVEMKKKAVYDRCQKELAFLENLAFHGMEDNCIILRPNLIEKAEEQAGYSLDDHPELLKTGILHSLNDRPIGSHIQSQIDYYFVHLTFQEHFAARYLVNALNSQSPQEAIQFIKSNKYNQSFGLVFTFASGLLTDKNLKLCLDTFWNTLLAEPLDLVGLRHIQLVISCIEEVNDKLEVPRCAEIIDGVKKWIKYALSAEHNTVYHQLTNSLQRSVSLVREETIKDYLIELLSSSNSAVRKNACLLIAALSTYNPQQQFLSPLIVALSDPDSDVRYKACEALSEMGEKAATNEVISKLGSAIGDEDGTVRRSVYKALGGMGEQAARSEVISKLVSALGDEDAWFVKDLYDAIGKMGEKAATSEVISKLVSALGDKDKKLRQRACQALGKMGENAATNEVISKLVNAFGDEDEYVRSSACEALVKIGEKAATSEVISKLVKALGDEDKYVRRSACETLVEMGEKAATSEVISKLVSALGDEDEYVRRSACKALGKMGENAATSEVISKLVSVFGDEDSSVRHGACYALGKMGEKTATSEVIIKLVSAFGDDNKYVRRSVCEALGQMGEKAATSEVISKLVSAVGDKDKHIRWSACEALGGMGEKAATSEVISKLVSALGDEDQEVSMKACWTLGKIGEKAATTELISKLSNALGEENEEVRRRVCIVLGEMGEKAATSEVISKLVSALGDENEYVRRSARVALGEMGEKAATSEVISNLVSALGDEDWSVRCSACEALGEMDEKAATSEVISKLVSALGDEDEYVRCSGCEALVKMGVKASASEVISKLVSALGDERKEVRHGACYALGRMGEQAARSEVISKLVSAISDPDSNVRRAACKAFGEMGEKAATSKVISKLVSALGDEDEHVRWRALEALGGMGEKAATSEVISKLVSALEDENKVQRRIVYEDPGEICEYEAMSQFANTLGNEYEYVSRRAFKTRGKIGEKAATIENITNLREESYPFGIGANRILEQLISVTLLTELDSDAVLKLRSYIDPDFWNQLRFQLSEMLIEVFLRTKSSVWLSVATRVSLREGVGVTVTEDSIMVYGSKEPEKLPCNDGKLMDQFVSAFMEQAVLLDLPSIRPGTALVSMDQENEFSPPTDIIPNADVKREKQSWKCCCVL